MENIIMGVYKIENLENNKVYIGSATNLHKRELEHFRTLKKGNHQNKSLQYAYEKSKKKDFKLELLEVVKNADVLRKREQFWMNSYDSMNSANGYNSCPSAVGGDANKIFRQKVEGERNGRVTIKAKDIPVICEKLNSGERVTNIAKIYGITPQIVNTIKSGKRWRDLAEIYLSDEILSTWKTPPLPKGIHPDSVSKGILKAICMQINKGISDEKIGDTYGLSETGVGVIRKGGCRSSETVHLLDDEIRVLWPYNIHLVSHLEAPKAVRKNISMEGKTNGNQKVTENQVIEICNMLNNGIATFEISEKYGLSTASINHIKNGKAHKKIGQVHLNETLRKNWESPKKRVNTVTPRRMSCKKSNPKLGEKMGIVISS